MEQNMSAFDCRAFMASVRQEAGEQAICVLDWRDLRCLLRLKGEDFVKAAYRLVLKREADPSGPQEYIQRAVHYPGRLCILLSLLLSPERVGQPAWLRRTMAAVRRFRKGR